MKRMLINATQPEELRVAIADGQVLIDLDIEVPALEQKKANVYKGRITRVEPSLEACFVDFGSERHGFLPLKEICPNAYHPSARKSEGKMSIRDTVKEGQEIIIQVEKEERGNKGAALTTYISLAGRYLVLMPTNPSAGGVSRRISGEDRQYLREQLQEVTAPDNVGIIIRTAGVGREAEELQWDLDYLLQLWNAIEKAAEENKASFLIYQESNLFIRALRDHLRNDIGEILIDDEKVFHDAKEFIEQVMPHNTRKLKHYQDAVPLFSRYQIESQIESAFARTVHLPSGGSMVIDHTEALLSIDINSARSTKGSDIEETAYATNLEAAEEVARQLRLRDLGGLIVIDFIDMMDRKHQRDVEERLRHSLQIDKARVQTGRISKFGLMEMSRQRLRPSLGESSQETCPRCDGHGTIRSIESLALSILRLLEEECMKEFSGQVVVQAPSKIANFLLNEKRKMVAEIESRHTVPIMILANEHMQRPKFEILRLRVPEVSADPSYSRIEAPQAELVASDQTQAKGMAMQTPAVSGVRSARPAPASPPKTQAIKAKPGLFGQFFARLFGTEESEKKDEEPVKQETSRQNARPTSETRPGTQSRPPQGSKRSRKRSGKKKTQRTADSAQRSKKATRKKASKKKGVKTGGRNPSRSQGQRQPATAAKAADQPAKDGNKDTGGQRKGRRRRSPYQTGGSKPREDQARQDKQNSDVQAPAVVKDAAVAKDTGPVADPLARSTGEKPAAAGKNIPEQKPMTEKKPAQLAKSIPDKPASDKPASDKPVKEKPASQQKTQDQAEKSRPKPAASSSGLAEPSKKTTSTSSEGAKAMPAPKPSPIQAVPDSKGIYTLKSTESAPKPPAADKPAQSPPPAGSSTD